MTTRRGARRALSIAGPAARRRWYAAAIGAAALAAGLAGCAPRAPAPGALTARPHRVTNEVALADAHVLAAWEDRLRRVRQRSEAEAPSPERAYVLAKAAAWLAMARDEYVYDARMPASDEALAEARRLIEALEAADPGPAPDARVTPFVTGTSRVRADLWAVAQHYRSSAAFQRVAEQVAELEVELVRAGRSGPGSERDSCRADLHLARALRLAGAIGIVAAAPDQPNDAGPRPIVAHAVHFAVNSANLSRRSVALLDDVVESLRGRGKLQLRLEGHADPRGGVAHNLALSRRRALAVRHYLEAVRVPGATITIRPYGDRLRAGRDASSEGYALDRRVELMVFVAGGSAAVLRPPPIDLQPDSLRAPRVDSASRAPGGTIRRRPPPTSARSRPRR